MLQQINICETDYSPRIIFNKQQNIFEIKGKSLMEDASVFYLPLILWVSEYVNYPNDKTELIIDLEYYNSSSAKRLVKLLTEFEKIKKKEKEIKIIWMYHEDDKMLKKRGLELQQTIKIPFEIKEYKN